MSAYTKASLSDYGVRQVFSQGLASERLRETLLRFHTDV